MTDGAHQYLPVPKGPGIGSHAVFVCTARTTGVPEGIVDTLQFAATAVFAAPVALFGLLKLAQGDPLAGVGFVAIAVGMLAAEEIITSPKDLPATVVERVVGRVAQSPDETDDD